MIVDADARNRNASARPPAVGAAVLLLLLLAAPVASAGSLSGVGASAPTQAKGAIEQWTFQFQTETAVPAGGDIRIQFPAGFQTSAGGTTACDVFSPAMSGETAAVVSATEVVCELGTSNTVGAGTTVTVGFTQIRNPAANGTYSVQVSTRNAANELLDAGAVTIQVREPAGPLHDLVVESSAQTTGTTTSWQFRFTTNTTVPGDGKIRIEFPTGFQTNSGSTTLCTVEQPSLQYGTTFVVNERIVLCTVGNTDTIPAGTEVRLTVTSMRNPVTEQRTHPFVIMTQTSSDATLDMDGANREDIVAHDFIGQPSVGIPDPRVNTVNTVSFSFTPYNAWAADGRLRIAFPPGFGFDTAGPGTTVASFVGGGSGTFQAPIIAGQDLVFARTGGQIVYGGTELRVNVTHVRNPSTAYDETGPFTLTTSDKDGGTHDSEAAPGVEITDGATQATTPTTNATAATTNTTANATTNATGTNTTSAGNATTGGTPGNQGKPFTGSEPPGSIFGDDADVEPADTPAPAAVLGMLAVAATAAAWRRDRR